MPAPTIASFQGSSQVSLNLIENHTEVLTVAAYDLDGDQLTYSLGGADAALFVINPDTGEVTFADVESSIANTKPGKAGPVYSFTVVATDADGDVAEQIFTITIESADYTATVDANSVTSGDNSSFIDGSATDDTLTGGAGSDTIYGNAGDDTIVGGDSNGQASDLIYGGAGKDDITSGAQNLTAFGGDGNDIIDRTNVAGSGGSVANINGQVNPPAFGITKGIANQTAIDKALDPAGDYLVGGAGDDTIKGGGGNDTIIGGSGNDILYGNEDADYINGGTGNDIINGGAGTDLLVGGTGNDIMSGGAGDDTLMLSGAEADYNIIDIGGGQFLVQDRRDSSIVAVDSIAGDTQFDPITGVPIYLDADGMPINGDIVDGFEFILFGDGAVVPWGSLSINNLPTADDDAANITEDTVDALGNALWITTGSLTVNDTDPNGDTLTIDRIAFSEALVSTGAEINPANLQTGSYAEVTSNIAPLQVVGNYGTLSINDDGTYTYTLDSEARHVQALDAGDLRTEVFTYVLDDGRGGQEPATLTVTINGTDVNASVATVSATIDATVAESGLATGTNPVDVDGNPISSANTSGSYTLSTPDGMNGVTLEWVDSSGTAQTQSYTYAEWQTLQSELAQVSAGILNKDEMTSSHSFALEHGTLDISAVSLVSGLTATGYSEVWTVNYDYTLTSNANHSTGPVADTLTIRVIDQDDAVVSSDTLDIAITDDAPLTTGPVDADGDIIDLELSVNEATLYDGDVTNDSSVGTVSFAAGADGIAASDIILLYGDLSLDLNGDTFDDITWTYALNTDGTDNKQVLIGSVGLDALIKLELTAADIAKGETGDVTVTTTLLSNFQHILTAEDGTVTTLDTLEITGLTVEATDADGDATTAAVIVTVADDAPTAADNVASVKEDTFTEDTNSDGIFDAVQASGNVITDGSVVDSLGADGALIFSAKHSGDIGLSLLDNTGVNAADNANAITLVGTYGTLTLNSDGSYIYELNNASDGVQGLVEGATVDDVFTYQLRDGDGDTSAANLTVTVTGTNEAPVAVVNADVVVNNTVASLAGNLLSDGFDLSFLTAGTFSLANLFADTTTDFVASYQNYLDASNANVPATEPVTTDYDPDGLLSGLSVNAVSFGGTETILTDTIQLKGLYGWLDVGYNGDYTYTLDRANSIDSYDAATNTADVALADIDGSTPIVETFSYNIFDGLDTSNWANLVFAFNDQVSPTVNITMTDTALSVGESTIVTFTFSELPVGFDRNDITSANGVISGLTVSAGSGGKVYTATFTPTTNVEDTSNVISVGTGYTDVAGNVGFGSVSANYTIDTAAPTASITLDANITPDDVINAAESGSTIAITGTVGGDVKNGDTVTLTVNGVAYTSTSTNGAFSIDVSGANLVADEGSVIDASVTTYDDAGNSKEATATENYTVDVTTPVIPTIDLATSSDTITVPESFWVADIGGLISDTQNGGDQYSQFQQTIVGDGSNGVAIGYTAYLYHSIIASDGSYTSEFRVTNIETGELAYEQSMNHDGWRDADFEQTTSSSGYDVIGSGDLYFDGVTHGQVWTVNVTGEQYYWIDPVGPDVSTSTDTDNITTDNTPTINGTAEANSTVTLVFDDGNASTTNDLTADVAVNSAGVWAYTVPDAEALIEGNYTLRAIATDAAGNTSSEAILDLAIEAETPVTGGGTSSSLQFTSSDTTYTQNEPEYGFDGYFFNVSVDNPDNVELTYSIESVEWMSGYTGTFTIDQSGNIYLDAHIQTDEIVWVTVSVNGLEKTYRFNLESYENLGYAPVVFDLDGGGVELLSAATSNVFFDMDGDGALELTGWAEADDGFLALDRNGNGIIDNGTEISFIDDLAGATTDMEGLVAYDTNGDMILDASDTGYGDFLLWQDANQDGISQANELLSLADAGIDYIDLNLTPTGDTTANTVGDVVVNTATYGLADGSTGTVGDAILYYIDQADVFDFNGAWGSATVSVFEDGIDLIDLVDTSLTFDDLTIVQDGTSTIVDDGFGNFITLEGTDASLITVDDFIF